MYITEKDNDILWDSGVIDLTIRYEELTNKECRPFNYEDYPYGAQTYVDHLKKLIADAEKVKKSEGIK